MSYGDVTKVVSGFAKIYLLETAITTPPITAGAITDLDSDTTWIKLGYTQDGINQNIETETYEVEVDQEEGPVQSVIAKQTATVSTILAETNLLNLARVIHGAAYTAGGTTASTANVMGIGGGTQSFNSLAIISNGPETNLDRLDFYPKVKPSGSIAEAFKRGESHQVPIEFMAYADNSIAAGSRLRVSHEETTAA